MVAFENNQPVIYLGLQLHWRSDGKKHWRHLHFHEIKQAEDLELHLLLHGGGGKSNSKLKFNHVKILNYQLIKTKLTPHLSRLAKNLNVVIIVMQIYVPKVNIAIKL